MSETTTKKPNSVIRRERAESAKAPGVAVATGRFLRYSARKGRLIADMIRGLPAPKALYVLQFTRRKAAVTTLRLLKSAIANAQDTKQLKPEQLYVKTVMVDEGPTMKRVMPRARGRADRISKRTCRATIVLGEVS
ncbi:MAG: 50S ribosomal protein L22 [Candidatus Wallbacteria bacterium]|nr:50S ribosomal protein L22 [Candidatus Wallbacteria bacterium]